MMHALLIVLGAAVVVWAIAGVALVVKTVMDDEIADDEDLL